ncbi:DUF1766-domain-containing protein, partial [Choiromyces venosus 120613-1]
MPFVPNTPESLSTLLARADSKNPSTTCCGVSNTGKSCRRELTRAKSGLPASGVIAVFNGQKVFFCEQHKDQSQNVVLRHTASFARKRELLGRGSMDSLIEQVELLVAGGKPGEVTTTTTVTSRTKRVSPEDDPFISPPKFAGPPSPPTSYQREKRRQQQQKTEKKQSFWSKLCCCCIPEGPEEDPHPRFKKEEAELRAAAAGIVENDFNEKRGKTHRRGKSNTHVDFESTPPTPPLPMMYPDRKVVHSALVNHGQRNNSSAATSRLVAAGRGMTPATPNYPSINGFGGRRNRGKQTIIRLQDMILTSIPGNPLIPPTLTEKTAQRLEQELAKPFSEQDEPGYIYIFWLTDSPISPQPTPASTPNPNGTPNKSNGRSHQRNASDALQKMVNDAENAQQGQRILLKIGRANNVQRRLHEWSTQCGYNLSLIRFYPHVSASSPGSTSTKLTTKALNKEVGKKVPNSHRIERLIHLELGDNPENRPDIKCDVCKKTHKEWFSVPATRAGLRGVDEVVKKWIEYGEKSAMVTGKGPTTQAPQIPKVTPAKAKIAASPPKKDDTLKSAIKRPTLQSAPVGTGVKAAAKKSSSPSRKASSGSAGKTKTDNSPNTNTKTSPSRSAKTPSSSNNNLKTPSPGKSARPRTPSRPPSSRGNASSSTAPKTTPPPPSSVNSSGRKKRPSGGRWKNYDENEGSEDYRPDDD